MGQWLTRFLSSLHNLMIPTTHHLQEPLSPLHPAVHSPLQPPVPLTADVRPVLTPSVHLSRPSPRLRPQTRPRAAWAGRTAGSFQHPQAVGPARAGNEQSKAHTARTDPALDQHSRPPCGDMDRDLRQDPPPQQEPPALRVSQRERELCSRLRSSIPGKDAGAPGFQLLWNLPAGGQVLEGAAGS